VKLARANAVLAGREFVTPEDVKAVAVPALAHRISLRPDSWVTGIKGERIVAEVLDSVPAPPPEPEGGP
jgi:MoxR-like ATPase